MTFDLDTYLRLLQLRESGGTPWAQAATSSAFGPYQFTRPTWQQYSAEPHGTRDPDAHRAAAQALTEDHLRLLRERGLPETPVAAYTLHHFGAGDGPKILTAAPDTPMAEVVSPAALRANPYLAHHTVGSWQAEAAEDFQMSPRDPKPMPPISPLHGLPGTPDTASILPGDVLAPGQQPPTHKRNATPDGTRRSFWDRITGNPQGLIAAAAAIGQGGTFADGALAFVDADQRAQGTEFERLLQSAQLRATLLNSDTAAANAETARARLAWDQEDAVADREHALALQRQQAARGYAHQQGLTYGNDAGEFLQEVFDPATGRSTYLGADGVRLDHRPDGFYPITPGASRTRVEDQYTRTSGVFDAAAESYGNLARLQRFTDAAAGALPGPQLYKQAGRLLATTLGIDAFANVADIQELKALSAEMELEKTNELMRGTGQITEGERAIVRRSIATIDTDPEAIHRLIDALTRIEHKKQIVAELYEEDLETGENHVNKGFLWWSRKNTDRANAEYERRHGEPAHDDPSRWEGEAGGIRFRFD